LYITMQGRRERLIDPAKKAAPQPIRQRTKTAIRQRTKTAVQAKPRVRKDSAFQSLIKELGIDETFTKAVKKAKVFTKVKTNIPMVEDYNFGADLLMLPETKQGYRYLLVVVDLANDDMDIEPIKNKNPATVLDAMKQMFKRDYINKPYASIRTDKGSEFQGKFKDYLYNESIIHKVALPNRHSQNSNAESLNRQLGRLLNGYMNEKEKATGRSYSEWTDVVDTVRVKLNKIRKKKLPKDWVTHQHQSANFDADPDDAQYKEGDLVHRILDTPRNMLGENQSGTFRMGDVRWETHLRKVKKVLYYPPPVPFRYVLEGLPNVSYPESQLMRPTKNEIEKEETERYIVQSIKAKRVRNKKVEYQVKWKNYPPSQNTWEPEENLLQDAPDAVAAFEKKKKKK
jgi:hypothetical protein